MQSEGSINNNPEMLYQMNPFHKLGEIAAFDYCQHGRDILAVEEPYKTKGTSTGIFRAVINSFWYPCLNECSSCVSGNH